MDDLFAWFGQTAFDILDFLSSELDLCPFPDVISAIGGMGDGLGWLNWVFPVAELVTTLNLWIVCMVAYYGWRWLFSKIAG